MASKSSAFDEDWRYRNWLGWRCDDGNGDGECDKTIYNHAKALGILGTSGFQCEAIQMFMRAITRELY